MQIPTSRDDSKTSGLHDMAELVVDTSTIQLSLKQCLYHVARQQMVHSAIYALYQGLCINKQRLV